MLPASENRQVKRVYFRLVLKPSELPTKTTFVGITDAIECPEMLSKWAAGLVFERQPTCCEYWSYRNSPVYRDICFPPRRRRLCVCGNIFLWHFYGFTLTFLFQFHTLFSTATVQSPSKKKKLLMNTLFFIVGITNEVSLREGILCFWSRLFLFFFLSRIFKTAYFLLYPVVWEYRYILLRVFILSFCFKVARKPLVEQKIL